MPEKIKILLAEDDPSLGTIFTEYLQLKGFEVTLCIDGELGLEEFKKSIYDLCILDIMMPKMDGFTLAKEIRSMNKNVPFIFLTAKSMREDKIQGFELGADDYITKPFIMEELLLRIKAILRRTSGGKDGKANNTFEVGKYNFDASQQMLEINKKEQHLTTKESELLKMLCLNVNEVLKREVALKMIWGDDDYFTARSMDVFITKLRKYLSGDSNIQIMNVHGQGFKLLVSA
ncbi:MAG: DNA-binding response regulator [Bacteroidetes bacterium]|nr:response regulator transcription factor [Bacteroidia bacterium]PCH68274.1 MAG: DNA-binding response regulator [Bacteroidota bacterium]